MRDSRIINENIRPAAATDAEAGFRDFAEDGAHCVRIAYVAGDLRAGSAGIQYFFFQGVQFVYGMAAVYEYVTAGFCEGEGTGAPDAPGRAGHEYIFLIHVQKPPDFCIV